MHLLNPALLAISTLVSHVAAHGVVISFTANGKTYAGEADPEQPTGAASPIRAVVNNGPVKDVTDKSMTCGQGAKVATLDVPVDAGSVATMEWTKPWPHDSGPIITYMASCGQPCSKVTDPSGLGWQKIDQLGAANSSDTDWVQGLLPHNSKPIQVTIPDKLKPGYYMIRHEIIALQLANDHSEGGAEFYPQCIQVEVKGTGNLVPSSSDIVHFPGAYKANDPGIEVDVYTPPDNSGAYNVKKYYKFPGGPIPTLVPDSNAGSSVTAAPPASASLSASPTSVPPATSTSEGATPSSIATESATNSIGSTSTQETTSATAAPSGTCHAKRGSSKRRNSQLVS
ncbi:glycosyl hydrolase family 61-domain-containing protein [Cerioporus squamosus]|nr:glycosyl hydrolase family 61-domain-containing protein [Cerioporus squamosus]KAI0702413.1 glycosyl hydrolase family 61-domain-containing protein [Cerioporus squamosus]